MSALVEHTDPSVMDKIAGKFGFPGQDAEPEAVVADAEPEQTEEVADDGLAELDWEGQSIKVPKGIKEALMRNDDFTRKTQELAESRRAVEQMRELAQTKQLEVAFSDSIADEQREIHLIDTYLQQAAKQDWAAMPTDQMFRAKIEIDNIKERRALLADSINGKRAKFTSEMQAKINELRGKSREVASKAINGFSEETEKTIREFAKSEGLAETEIDNVLLDPRSFKILWKASQFDKIKAGTAKAGDAASKVDRVLRPGVAGERMPAKTADKLNFSKAMKAAGGNSTKAARVIEDRLAGVFSKR